MFKLTFLSNRVSVTNNPDLSTLQKHRGTKTTQYFQKLLSITQIFFTNQSKNEIIQKSHSQKKRVLSLSNFQLSQLPRIELNREARDLNCFTTYFINFSTFDCGASHAESTAFSPNNKSQKALCILQLLTECVDEFVNYPSHFSVKVGKKGESTTLYSLAIPELLPLGAVSSAKIHLRRRRTNRSGLGSLW